MSCSVATLAQSGGHHAEGAGGDGDAERARHARPSTDDADDASTLGGGPMTPIASTGDESKEAALVATSSYSPLEAETSDAPELPRVDQGCATPRDCSFAGCTSACRAVGVRRPWTPI
jgi:hypothetical protein